MAWLYPPTEKKTLVVAFFLTYLACSLAVTVCLGLEMQSGLEYIDKYISLITQDIQKYGEENSPFGLWNGCNISLQNTYELCVEAMSDRWMGGILFIVFLVIHICFSLMLVYGLGWCGLKTRMLVAMPMTLFDGLFIGLTIYNINYVNDFAAKMRAVLERSHTTPVSELPDFHPALSWQALLIVLFSGIAAKIMMHGYFAFMHARRNRATSRQYELVYSESHLK